MPAAVGGTQNVWAVIFEALEKTLGSPAVHTSGSIGIPSAPKDAGSAQLYLVNLGHFTGWQSSPESRVASPDSGHRS
jgi:hypothetical protein